MLPSLIRSFSNTLDQAYARTWAFPQFFRYCSVGVLNTLISLVTSFVLLASGLNVFASNLIGYVVAIGNSFILNRKWTFNHTGRVGNSLIKFLVICGTCYVIQLAVLWSLIERLSLGIYISQVYAMSAYTLLSFLANKYIAFNSTQS
jgi:putative flippase GtrA